MIMSAHNACASRKGDAHHLFPGNPPYARAKRLNPQIRDAHQQIVMRSAGLEGRDSAEPEANGSFPGCGHSEGRGNSRGNRRSFIWQSGS